MKSHCVRQHSSIASHTNVSASDPTTAPKTNRLSLKWNYQYAYIRRWSERQRKKESISISVQFCYLFTCLSNNFKIEFTFILLLSARLYSSAFFHFSSIVVGGYNSVVEWTAPTGNNNSSTQKNGSLIFHLLFRQSQCAPDG